MKNLLALLSLFIAFVSNAQTVSISSSATGAICAGTNVTFTASLTGYTTPSYQWYKNNVAIAGATNAVYSSSSLSNNDVINVAVFEGGATVSTSGLVLNLDAGNSSSYSSGATTWTDLSGRGNNGTLSSVAYSSSNQGYLTFNGTSSYVSLPNSTDFNFGTGDFAVEFWTQNTSTTKTPNFLAINSNNGFYSSVRMGWAPNINGNPTMTFAHSTNGTSWAVQTGFTASLSNWTQIVISRTAGVVTMYANGVNKGTYNLSGSLMTTTTSNPTYNQIGTLPNWQSVYTLQGNMSIVRYYNGSSLSTSQVISNYNSICSRYGLNPIGTTSNSITTTVNASPSIPAVTVTGDACINKTNLTTTTGLSSYTWYKDNVSLSGATTNTYLPTVAGDYKVAVSNGTCSSTSSATTLYTCGVTADGKMVNIATPGSLLSLEGGANFGTGIDDIGKIINTTGLTTTTGTISATAAVLGGVISATNAVTSSIGVIYSTDANFSTSSSATIQSNVVAGAYTSSIIGLSSSTAYYAKSFVVNKAGTSYGPVVSFTTPAAYVAPIITTTGLVLNLDAAHPDSYSGSGTTWTDVSNNNNSVTLPSVLASSYSATTGGGSFTFNSNNAINKFSSTSINNWNINTTNAISVETWIKYTSNGGLQFYFQDAALNYRYGFDQNGHFYYDLGCHCDRNPSTATLTADTWHHLVITAGKEAANGNRIKSRFYIDGAQVYSNDEGMSSLPNITTPYYFGDDNYHSYPLNANAGVIRVYKSALSQAEITLNFNAQKARFGF